MFTKGLFASLVAVAVQAHTAEEWKARSVYQLLTDRYSRTDGSTQGCGDLHNYCGGTFKGIQDNLDYITGMGFDAIWISPIPHNAPADYHGYGALDWERVNENFGTADELHDLIDACHERDVWVMLDVVANHSSYYAGSDFSDVHPLNDPDMYHPKCDINDWGNQYQVENCWLSGLPDLDQSNPVVRDYLKKWIKTVVETFDFDGIRIDTIPHVPKDFWTEYGQAAGVFQMGEVFNGDVNYVGDYQNYVTGLFNYPMFFTIKDVFGAGKSMYQIRSTYESEEKPFKDIEALGSFMDNHDNARFLSQYDTWTGFKSAITFALTARGIPFFYYGDEQGYRGGNDPENRESLWDHMDTNAEVYQMVSKINAARKSAQIWNFPYVERYVLDNFFAFSKGDMVVMTTNSTNRVEVTMPYLPYSAGTEVCNIFRANDECQTVTDQGIIAVLENGESKVWLPKNSSYFNAQTAEFLI